MNNAIANLLLRVRSDTKEGQTGLAALAAELKAFGGIDSEAEAKIETRRASKVLRQLHLDLAEFSRETAEARADVDTKEARIHLDFLEERLDAVNREHVTPEADVKIAQALAKLKLLRREMSATAHQGSGIDTDKILREFISLSTIVGGISKNLHNFDTEGVGFFSRISTALKSARVNIGPFSTALSTLGRLWLFLIPKAVALGASIISIGSAVVGAVAGFAALGTAAIALGGAFATIGIGAIARFTSASQAVQQYKNAMSTLRQATIAQRDAERNLAQAQDDADKAQRDLTQARREARQTIATDLRDAVQAQATAEYNLSTAQDAQIQAQTDLTQAREDARRALIDLESANKHAALTEKQARIDLARAREEAAGFAKDDNSLEAKQARLDLREAELALSDAKTGSKRSEQDLQEAEKKGISGSDQVVAARQALTASNESLTQANIALAGAIRDVNAAQQATVGRDEGVASARQALADANERITDSQHQLQKAEIATAKAQRQVNQAYRQAAPLLSGAGKALREAIRRFRTTLEESFGPGIDALWKGVANSLNKNIGPLVKSMRVAFTRLGQAIGNAIQLITTGLNSQAGREFFNNILNAATATVPLLTRGFVALARIFGNIAQASMPFLIDGLESLVGLLEDFANATSDSAALGGTIGMLVGLSKTLLKLFGAVANALLQIFKASAGPGQELLTFFTDAINKWAEWAATTEGQDTLKQFFQDMVPLTKGIIDLFVELAELFINIGKFLVPAMAVINKVMTTFLDIVNDVLGLFNDLPGPIKTVLGLFLLWKGPVKIVQVLAGWLGKLLEAIIGKKLFSSLGTFASRFVTVFASIGARLGPLIATIGTAITTRLLPLLARVGPALLAMASPAGIAIAALAALIPVADDIGKGFASILGYSDASIQQAQEQQDALGHLADALFDVNSVLRNLKGISTQEDLFAAFSKKQVDRMQEILANGGTLAGKAWIRNTVRSFKEKEADLRRGVGDVVGGAADVALGKKHKFEAAGNALGKALADGIKAAIGAVRNVAKGVAQAVRNIFPGSEPKDPSSPLRGLQDAGRAIVANIAKGIDDANTHAPHRLAARMRADLGRNHRVRSVDNRREIHQRFHMPVSVAGGGYPDAESYFAAANRAARARGIALD